MILASNHISHFDPLLLGTFFARYVDWMAMEELFSHPLAASILDWLWAFRVTRNGRDRLAMRIALRRLEVAAYGWDVSRGRYSVRSLLGSRRGPNVAGCGYTQRPF